MNGPSTGPGDPAPEPPDMLTRALAQAALGRRTFPLRPRGKLPIVDDWPGQASADPDRVARFWTDPVTGEAQDWNVGVVTGEGLFVLDVDDKDGKDGSGSLAFLEDLHGELPPTLTIRTPTGGRHVYFKVPPDVHVRNSVGELGEGLDVKGARGFVVAPGSLTPLGEYTVEVDAAIADAPAWLFDKVRGDRPPARAENVAIVGELDVPGNVERAAAWLRNHAPAHGSYATACRMLDLGLSPPMAAELMVEHWNDRRLAPRDYEHFLARAEHAAQFRRSAIGSATASEFEDVSAEPFAASAEPRAEWPEPEDLWREVGAPPDLPRGILPAALEAWCLDEATRKGVSLGATAVPAIVVFAAALSARFEIQVKQFDDQHTERGILWGALVGGPGARKSPVLKELMKPIEVVEKGWRTAYARDLSAYEARLAATKRQKEATDPAPRKPRRRCKVIMDATTESVVLVEAENPDGLLLYLDELAGWAGGMDAYRSGRGPVGRDAPFWLSAKNGAAHQVNRVSRDAVSAEVHAVHVLGGIQPDVIRKLAQDWGGNGLMQRFLLVHLDNAGRAPDRTPDETARRAVYQAIATILALEPNDFNDRFRFARDADGVRQQLLTFQEGTLAAADVPVPLQGWLAKLEGEWARIALVFHVAEWATGPGALVEEFPPDRVSLATAERAFRFLAEFQAPQQVHFYRHTAGVAAARDGAALAVAGHVLAHGTNELSDRDLQTKFRSRLSGPNRQPLRAAVMAELELAGWAEPIGHGGSGRPTRWKVSPLVHDGRFTARAAAELAARSTRQNAILTEGAKRSAERAP